VKIPKAYKRAQKRVREGATPLYKYIMGKLHGLGMGPMGVGPGALTMDFVKAVQGPGRRGHVDVTFYEPPGAAPRANKFLEFGAQKFDGKYPVELADSRKPPPSSDEPD